MSISTPRTYEYNNATLFGPGIFIHITKEIELLFISGYQAVPCSSAHTLTAEL